MDEVVKKIIEIEATGKAIVKSAEDQKYTVEKELQGKRDQFDKELEAETKAKVDQIRSETERTMNGLIDEQKDSNQSTIDTLIQDYNENHAKYAQEILKKITEV